MNGPMPAYQQRVEDGAIRFDHDQTRAIEALQALAQVLQRDEQALHKRLASGLRALRRKRQSEPAARGLYLYGAAGRGKSMLMDLFFDTVKVAPKRRVHFHAFMHEVHAGMITARKGGTSDPVQPVADAIADNAALLCFDEMQITDITDAMLVGRLFERLFARGVVIVATSNRHPDDLYKGGWNRDVFLPFIALIKDRMDLVELASPTDHRRERPLDEQGWFAPHDAQAVAALDALWDQIAHDRPEQPLRIRAHGRTHAFLRSAGRALRADFDELCGQPLGPADYLALAEAIEVLVLEGVPILSPKRSNEAKRFVTLIDALYEAKVRLIVSAAGEPDDLYPEGEGAFEFGRTASRLEEMRSTDWSGQGAVAPVPDRSGKQGCNASSRAASTTAGR